MRSLLFVYQKFLFSCTFTLVPEFFGIFSDSKVITTQTVLTFFVTHCTSIDNGDSYPEFKHSVLDVYDTPSKLPRCLGHIIESRCLWSDDGTTPLLNYARGRASVTRFLRTGVCGTTSWRYSDWGTVRRTDATTSTYLTIYISG